MYQTFVVSVMKNLKVSLTPPYRHYITGISMVGYVSVTLPESL